MSNHLHLGTEEIKHGVEQREEEFSLSHGLRVKWGPTCHSQTIFLSLGHGVLNLPKFGANLEQVSTETLIFLFSKYTYLLK